MDNRKKEIAHDVMLAGGMLILLITAVMPLFNIHNQWLPFVFLFGATLTLAARLVERYHGKNTRIRRLFVLAKISAVLFCISAALMFHPVSGANDWIAFLLAGAVVQIYVSFVLDRELRKEKND